VPRDRDEVIEEQEGAPVEETDAPSPEEALAEDAATEAPRSLRLSLAPNEVARNRRRVVDRLRACFAPRARSRERRRLRSNHSTEA